MGRNKGSANFAGSLEVLAGAPLDARTVVDSKSDLTAANTFPYFHEGITVYVKADKKKYTLIGDDPTVATNWKEEGGGSQGSGEPAGVSYSGTLTVADWDSNTKQQTVTFTDYDASYNGVIGVPADATAAQKEAYCNNSVTIVSQSGATVTFEAETIPDVAIPVVIYCGGGSSSEGGTASFPEGGTAGQVLRKASNEDNDVEWGDVGAEAFVVTITLDENTEKLVADKTPKELEDAIANNTTIKAALPMYGLSSNLSVNAGDNFAFSTFYIENEEDISTSAFATILMVKDTDSAWESIVMQTIQGNDFSKEVKCGADLLTQRGIYLEDIDHEEDSENYTDVIKPHKITPGEWSEIMSTLPGAPVQKKIYSPIEQEVGEWQEMVDGVLKKKPVYEKMITGTATSTKSTEQNIGSPSSLLGANVEKFVNIDASLDSEEIGGSTNNLSVQAYTDRIYVGQRFGSASFTFKYYIVFSYTKTTDQWETVV